MFRCCHSHDPIRPQWANCIQCDPRKRENRLLAVLSFLRDELVYDVENVCYVEGDIIPGEDQAVRHVRHTTQDVGQRGNIDRITRQFDLRVSEVEDALFPYTKRPVPVCDVHLEEGHQDHHPWDDRLRETPEYRIFLTLPEDFSETTVVLLERLIHEYLVARAIEDWMMITVPDKGRLWREKADMLLQQIKDTRGRPHMRTVYRRPMHPF